MYFKNSLHTNIRRTSIAHWRFWWTSSVECSDS